MIKYLEVPDFHFSPENEGICISNGSAVEKTAVENEVDLILVPGDLHHAPLYATNKGGHNTLRDIVSSWASIAPVIAIEGTPSHDGPGAYDGLPVTVLEMGKVYGYYPEWGVKELDTGCRDGADPLCKAILFGFPELSKKNIQAKLGLSAEEANGMAEELFKQYMYDFVAPMRMKYSMVPALGLFHGNISDRDRSNESDMILKSSDIVVRQEWFEDAGIDRLSCGHIHLPKEWGSGGYAGSWGSSWDEVGFKPGFNMISLKPGVDVFEGHEDDIEVPDGYIIHRRSIPYGTPERRVIRSASQALDPSIAYWLKKSKPEDPSLPDNVHPWSRETIEEVKSESRRVTAEEAENAQSLWDLALLFDPKTPEDLKPLFDEIGLKVESGTVEPKEIILKSVTVSGCVFFKGDDISLNMHELESGLTHLHGDNGSGKSSLLSFCSPYPVIIGKDTDSGRSSAIKDFFNKQGSKIEKVLTVNGVEHKHLITIKAAHTQNPKTECSLTVDGRPMLDKGTFDEMMSECEKLYGDFHSYKITSFYEQPQQSKGQVSGLMSATKTEARDLVLGITGIDREAEKRYALDRKKFYTDKLIPIQAEIDILSRDDRDPAEIKADIEAAENEKNNTLAKIDERQKVINSLNDELSKLNAMESVNKSNRARKADINNQIKGLDQKITALRTEIIRLDQKLKDIPEAKARIESDDKSLILKAQSEKLLSDYAEEVKAIDNKNAKAKNDYDSAVNEERALYNEQTAEAKAKLSAYHEQERKQAEDAKAIESYVSMINESADPCEHCGKMSSSAKSRISSYKDKISELEGREYPLAEPEPIPEYKSLLIKPMEWGYPTEPFAPPVSTLWEDERAKLETLIASAGSIQPIIDSKQKDINEALESEKAMTETLESIIIRTDLLEDISNKRVDLSNAENIKTGLSKEMESITSSLINLKRDLEDIQNKAEELAVKQGKLAGFTGLAAGWSSVADLLSSNKIPALELDMVLDSIDSEATKNIHPFRESIYSFKTNTQEMGKKKQVDKFDIMIHDATTGEYRSLFKHSPGEKAFFNDAFIKALIKKRLEKSKCSYSPLIMDEADGPISPEKVPSYYEIQNRYFTDQKVLVVSHARDAKNYIQNTINIGDLKR